MSRLAAAVAVVVAVLVSGCGSSTKSTSTSASGQIGVAALGDSYTAGNGAGHYLSSSGDATCHRSSSAYPWRFADVVRAQGKAAELFDVACSGAETSDVAGQLSALGSKTAAVDIALLTIGGNDLGFSKILPCLASPADAVALLGPLLGERTYKAVTRYCSRRIPAEARKLRRVLRKVERALRRIGDTFPHASVVLVGYPDLTSPACGSPWDDTLRSLQERFDRGEADVVGRLNRGGGSRFHFVDVAATFDGHGPCAAKAARDVNNAVRGPSHWESFHPTAQGHELIASTLQSAGGLHWAGVG